MTEQWQVVGDAAQVYERELVPALFAEWPQHALRAAGVKPGQRVLDVACGTGVVARAALDMGCVAVGVDLNEAMLQVARSRAPNGDFFEGSASSLPFEADSFDAAIMQFALMYVPDRVLALSEMRRVVIDGGPVVAVVWAPIDTNPGYRALANLFDDVAGEHAMTFRSPYSFGVPEVLESTFTAAGLRDVDVRTVEGVARFSSVDALLRGEIDGSPLAGRLFADDPELVKRATATLAEFIEPDGRVVFPNPAVIVRGIA
jgi:ubiquinone/menaquinone biosynthesis C-methylase UbiE